MRASGEIPKAIIIMSSERFREPKSPKKNPQKNKENPEYQSCFCICQLLGLKMKENIALGDKELKSVIQ